MKRFALAFTALSMAWTAPAFADPADEFQSLLSDHWDWVLSQSPTFATSLGVRDYDDRLGSLTLDSMDAAREKRQEFLTRLRAIDRGALNETDICQKPSKAGVGTFNTARHDLPTLP